MNGRAIQLKCPVCGANLSITQNLERFACAYCGTEQIVERGGGIIAVRPIVEAISKVEASTDKTAAELALRRLETELAYLLQERAKVEAEIEKSVQGRDKGVGAFLIISSIVSVLGLVMAVERWWLFIPLAAFVVFVIWITRQLSTETEEIRGRLTQNLTPLDTRISKVKSEIQKNHAVVDS